MSGIPVFRAPMRSRSDDVPDGAAVERALSLGLVGIGGRLAQPPAALEDALVATDVKWGERMARRLERFAAAPEGAFVWTRDADEVTWLGRLAGPWRYDASMCARRVDLVHVRGCDWLPAPIDPAEVPRDVRATFARGGRNWQRVATGDASTPSAALWRARRG